MDTALPSERFAANTDTTTHTRIRDPRLRTIARLAWVALVLLAVGLIVATLPMQFNYLGTVCEVEPCPIDQLTPVQVSDFQQLGLSLDFYAQYTTILWIAPLLPFVAVAVLIFWRKSDDWMALFVSLMLVTNAATWATSSTTIETLLVPVQPFWYWPNVLVSALGFGSLGIIFCLFPDGRFVPSWTRWLALAWLVTTTIQSVRGFNNLASFPAWPLGLLVTLATSVAAQVYRYRRVSSPLQRQQTKWVVGGFAVIFILGFIGFVPPFIFPSLSPFQHGPLAPLYMIFILYPFAAVLLSLLPVTIAFSMLRYRLWDVDLYLNRSLVYGGLTLALAIVFLGGLFLLQSVLGAVLGGQQTTAAALISAVVIVGLFNPARRRLQNLVDRRFYHLRVDLNQLAELQKPKVVSNPGALSGTTLGAYQVGEVLGRGGMGEVYKGRQTGLDRPVAIKVLPPEFASNAELLARFEREAKIVANLRHPNIVEVFDFGTANDTHYIVMEFVDGVALSDYVRERGALSLAEVQPVIHDMAGALDYAHEQGLVHRDVKASNIMLQKITTTNQSEAPPRPYKAILMDFGITKHITSGSGLTHTGAMGTIDYMAPEQIMSAKAVDRRADIYALGVVLYELLTGERPFKGSAGQVLFAHLQQPPPDPHDVKDDIPSPVAGAVMKAMAKKPDERFQTAGEFAAALG